MLIAQAQQAYENLPEDQQGDEGMFLFILLSEIGVTLIVVLILYFVIVKPQRERRKQEEADRADRKSNQ